MTKDEDRQSVCPGCGLRMPLSETAVYDGYFNATPECWSVYGEVLEAEFSNAILFGRVHQLTVDSYAVQHAGGQHPDKSVDLHLCGLHLVLERDVSSTAVPSLFQRLVRAVEVWPHFAPPEEAGPLTVFDVAMADNPEEHAAVVRRWAEGVWKAWSMYHTDVVSFLDEHLDLG